MQCDAAVRTESKITGQQFTVESEQQILGLVALPRGDHRICAEAH